MRIVALIVVACGCRVGAQAGIDATTPRGDGLPERVLTDSALWADVRILDSTVDRPSGDRFDGGDAAPVGDSGGGDVDGGGRECALFDNRCPNQEGCYPDEAISGRTRCLQAGAFPVLAPCLLQDNCAPGEICIDVGGTGRVCRLLCVPAAPGFSCIDAGASACISLSPYPGVGYCL